MFRYLLLGKVCSKLKIMLDVDIIVIRKYLDNSVFVKRKKIEMKYFESQIKDKLLMRFEPVSSLPKGRGLIYSNWFNLLTSIFFHFNAIKFV